MKKPQATQVERNSIPLQNNSEQNSKKKWCC